MSYGLDETISYGNVGDDNNARVSAVAHSVENGFAWNKTDLFDLVVKTETMQ